MAVRMQRFTSGARGTAAEVSDARKLKKLLAEQLLDNSTLKEILEKKLLTPGSRRYAADWAITDKSYPPPP